LRKNQVSNVFKRLSFAPIALARIPLALQHVFERPGD
jgi:hypothetical protein